MFRKNGKCSKCGSHDRRYGEYTRAWNDLCKQAAGDAGYYCMICKHIDFHTPDFEHWLSIMPVWIVRKKGDKWRVAVEQSVQSDDACAVCGKTHREHVVINLGHVFVIPHHR